MKDKFNFRSIGARTSLLVIAVLAVAIGITSEINKHYYKNIETDRIKREISEVAANLGSQLNLTMFYNATHKAQEIINTLDFREHYVLGCVYNKATDSNEGVFVSYKSPNYPNLHCPDDINHEMNSHSSDGRFILASVKTYDRFKQGDDGKIIEVKSGDSVPSAGYIYVVASVDSLLTTRGIVSDVPLFAAMIAIFPVVVIFIYLQRSITSPVTELRYAVTEFENKGELKKPLLKKNKDEVGELMRSFERMTKKIYEKDQTIRDQNNRLNVEVDMRTNELRKAVDNLKSFTHSVSHDLIAPLRHTDAYLNITLEDDDSLTDKTRDNLENAVKCVDKMFGLIDSFMKLSEVNESELKKKRVNLSLIVDRVVAEQRKSKPSNVKYIIQEDVYATCDDDLIEILLTNLFDNAIKYRSFDRKTFIEFGARRESATIVYFVKDNGVGFDDNLSDNAFKLFKRLNKDSSRGYGVGLATVKRIVERHGGRIWVSSTPNVGSVFKFTLDSRRKDQLQPPSYHPDPRRLG